MLADKLQTGDEIRVIAPSRSLSVVWKSVFKEAESFLLSKGYKLTYSKHCNEIEYNESAGIKAKVEDLHTAFLDKNVKAVLPAIGGFNVNQILEYIDYSIIKENPKIISGFSDLTALLNAVYAKTGLVTYHGPMFSSFGFEERRDYTNDYFERCLFTGLPYLPKPSSGAYEVIKKGKCEGTLIGGNLCTLNLLQGTEYFPEADDAVLFIEDDNIMGDYFVPEFERNLQSLLQVKNLNIRGMVFGRFSEDCKLNSEAIARIVKDKKQLENIPIIFNADFGHIFPFFTFPIGGKVRINAENDNAEITITEH